LLLIFVCVDSAKISVNDLENILETETPPQSPPPTTNKVNEEVFIEMVRESGTTTVKYKVDKDEKGEPEDRADTPASTVDDGRYLCFLNMTVPIYPTVMKLGKY